MSRKRHLTIGDLSAEFVVGLFFFMALAVLAYFTIVLSKETFFGEHWELQIQFPHIAGLSEGDSVMARGVKVGKVKNVELSESKVLLTASLTKQLKIHQGYSVDVRYSSILGGRYVSIDQGAGNAELVSLDEPLEGDAPADVLTDTSDLINEIRDQIQTMSSTFEESRVLPKMAAVVDDLRAVTSQLREGKGSLGKLIHDDRMYESVAATFTQLQQGIERLDKVAANIDSVVTDARSGKGTLGKLLTDDGLYDDSRAIAGQLRNGKGTLGKLLTEEAVYEDLEEITEYLRSTSRSLSEGQSTIGRLVQDDGELYESLVAAAGNSKDISQQIRAGEGTVGKLVMDDALYIDIRNTVKELQEAIEDFREQAPISTFGSFVFGAF